MVADQFSNSSFILSVLFLMTVLLILLIVLIVFEQLFLLLDALHYLLVVLVGELAAAGGDEDDEHDDGCHQHAVDHLCAHLAHRIIIISDLLRVVLNQYHQYKAVSAYL